MTGGPALSGASQLTRSEPAPAGATRGAPGGPGASLSSSVTVTTIVCSAIISRGLSPPVAVTTTTYSLLPPSLVGSVLASSPGSSKFGASLKVRTPPASMPNRAWSDPPVNA